MHESRVGTTVILGAALLVALAACSEAPSPSVPDPTSTADLAVAGGASYPPLSPTDLAERAEVIAEVEVIDVKPSITNTADGGFPDAAQLTAKAEKGHPLAGLTVTTPVEVRVLEVLSVAPRVTFPIDDEMVIYVAGGAITATLDETQARLLGISTVDEAEDLDRPQPEVPVTGPVDITWGQAPSVVLVEGDTYVVFLAERDLPSYTGAGSKRAWRLGHPADVWERSPDGWKPQAPLRDARSAVAADLSEMVVLVRNGP